MPAANPYASVPERTVMNASKEELTLLLYEGAIKFCDQALQAMAQNNFTRAHLLIARAEDIIRELQITLDHRYAIAQNFDSLYEYMNRRLAEGFLKKDSSIIMEIRGLLRELRDTWKEAIKI